MYGRHPPRMYGLMYGLHFLRDFELQKEKNRPKAVAWGVHGLRWLSPG